MYISEPKSLDWRWLLPGYLVWRLAGVSGRPQPGLSSWRGGGDSCVVTREVPGWRGPLVASPLPVLRRWRVVGRPHHGLTGMRGRPPSQPLPAWWGRGWVCSAAAWSWRGFSVWRGVTGWTVVPVRWRLWRWPVGRGWRRPTPSTTRVSVALRRGRTESGWPDLPARWCVARVPGSCHSSPSPSSSSSSSTPDFLLVWEVRGVTACRITASPAVRAQPRIVRLHLLQPPGGDWADQGLAVHHARRGLPYGRLAHLVDLVDVSTEGARLLHLLLSSLPLPGRLAGVQRGPLEDELDIIGVLAPLGQHLQQQQQSTGGEEPVTSIYSSRENTYSVIHLRPLPPPSAQIYILSSDT